MHDSDKHRAQRLPVREKIAWGLGGFSEQMATNGLNTLFVPIYNIGFGLLNPRLSKNAAMDKDFPHPTPTTGYIFGQNAPRPSPKNASFLNH